MLCETSDVQNHLINHIIGNTKVYLSLYVLNTRVTIYKVPVHKHSVYMHISGGYSDTRVVFKLKELERKIKEISIIFNLLETMPFVIEDNRTTSTKQ